MNVFSHRYQRQSRSQPVAPTPPAVAPPPREPSPFSRFSSAGVKDSAWCSTDFMLGAGMAIIQPSTKRVVVVYEKEKKYWFLPKGRKDIGESLEETALREAYEESGFRVSFLPLYTHSRAHPSPDAPRGSHLLPNTEPVFICTHQWRPRPNRNRRRMVDNGGEYVTAYYVGQIAEDAICEDGTRMADEQDYETYLLTINDALRLLRDPERRIMEYAWALWEDTVRIEAEIEEAERMEGRDART